MEIIKKQGRPKSEEKYYLILEAASYLFLNDGFANTSMDMVARASGVSKQTVYSHFESKDALFQAAITSKCRAYHVDTQQLIKATAGSRSLYECLIKVGAQLVRLFQDEDVIAMFRVIIAEAGKNPHVATLFYQAGPRASLEILSDVVERYGKGQLSKARAHELAVDFCSLIKSELHTMMLFGIQSPLPENDIEEHVKRAAEKIELLFIHYTYQDTR